MLTDSDGLLDELIEILGNLGSEGFGTIKRVSTMRKKIFFFTYGTSSPNQLTLRLEFIILIFNILNYLHNITKLNNIHTVGLQDTENLVTSDTLNLSNAVGITQNHTNLGRSHTLLGKLEDLLANLLGGGPEPGGGSTAVGEGTVM